MHVAPHALLALLDERLDAELFDLLFGVDAQFFADFHFDRQPVGVPASLALAQISAHGAVAREQVFDGPGEAVARVRHAVGGWRAFVKDKPRCTSRPSTIQRFFVDFRLTPEAQHIFFELGEVDAGFNGSKHEAGMND